MLLERGVKLKSIGFCPRGPERPWRKYAYRKQFKVAVLSLVQHFDILDCVVYHQTLYFPSGSVPNERYSTDGNALVQTK